MLTTAEFEIIAFMKCYRGQYLSGREICRRAGSKRQYQENPRWALPLLVGLLVRGYVEADAGGHYRLVEKTEERSSIPSSAAAAGPISGAPAINIDEAELTGESDEAKSSP